MLTRLSWVKIQNGYADESAEHPARTRMVGLEWPVEVFEQLFHNAHHDGEPAEYLRFVDWKAVRWEEGELSGVAPRRAGVPRAFQHA